jgi:mono/diheme cytochrome c family protein
MHIKSTASTVTAAALLLCAFQSAFAQARVPLPTQDPVVGAQLFRARGCSDCHGSDLGRLQQVRSLYGLAAAMWNHLPKMASRIRGSDKPRPYFTAGEMSDLVAFLYASDAGGPSGSAGLAGDPGDPKRGEQLVTSKGCTGCHSITGPGGKRAGSLNQLKGYESPWSVVAQMWNHSFLMVLEAERPPVAWVRLSPDEMADLVAFLQTLMR